MKYISKVESISSLVFYFGVAFLLTHEMDAVINVEWRLLFHLRNLDDAIASYWFVALHFPIFLAFIYFTRHPMQRVRDTFRLLVSIFLIVHSVLHFRLSSHPQYHFDSLISNIYIYAAGTLGFVYLLMVLVILKTKPSDRSDV